MGSSGHIPPYYVVSEFFPWVGFIVRYLGLPLCLASSLNCFCLLSVLCVTCIVVVRSVKGICQNNSFVGCLGEPIVFVLAVWLLTLSFHSSETTSACVFATSLLTCRCLTICQWLSHISFTLCDAFGSVYLCKLYNFAASDGVVSVQPGGLGIVSSSLYPSLSLVDMWLFFSCYQLVWQLIRLP